MARIAVEDLTFAYEGSYDNVFEHASFTVDSRWRLGLVGRNGRGKTTLLRLLQGQLLCRSSIDMPVEGVYFPFQVTDPSRPTLEILEEMAGDALLWKLRREMNLLGVAEDTLYRPFDTLSKGEQTKAQLAALFSREDAYPLIDEPTNHLDLPGREAVGDFLLGKDGFLLVSHDRAFLNRCVDHILHQPEGHHRHQGQLRYLPAGDGPAEPVRAGGERKAEKDIRRLNESARRTAQWSQTIEKSKYAGEYSGNSPDRGYIGARSAAMMKRALNVQRRQEQAAEEKSKLLKNVEKVGELKLSPLVHPKKTLVQVRDGLVRYEDRVVCRGISFALRQGERLALAGPNGAGKSSVLKTLCGLSQALAGEISLAPNLIVSYVPQSTRELGGDFREFILREGLDETLFKAILRNMDFGREQFDKDLAQLSVGQKKMLLAKSLCEPAHLYVWDEPLNFIDLLSRVQVEELLLQYQPTMLLVEHDRAFWTRCAPGWWSCSDFPRRPSPSPCPRWERTCPVK